MNGIGRPVTGMIFIVIPTFWNTCHSSIVKTPAHRYVPNMSRDRLAIRQMRTRTMANVSSTAAHPTSPNCSPRAANGKSAQMTGMSRPLVSGPCSHPLPKRPPVPTARTALVTWYTSSCRSGLASSKNTRTRVSW